MVGALAHWLDWSKQAGDVYNEDDALTVWSSIRDDGYAGQPITVGSIFRWAKQAGWEKPRPALEIKDDAGEVVAKIEWPDVRGKSADPNSARNISAYLKARKITPWYNDFDQCVYISDYPSTDCRLTDATALDLRMAMHDAELRCSKELCIDRVTWEANKNKRHPVRDYLNGLVWKGVPRLDSWLAQYCGAEKNRYHSLVGAKTLIAAVRRVRRPGCKFDTTLILEGPQGAKKSSVLRTLASDAWFTDGIRVGADPKETIELTCGKWIAEMAELSGMSKRDVNEVKQALSKQSDRARMAYGRFSAEVDRQFILCGTTNNAQYLRDKTGNRRFWCVAVGKINIEALKEDRAQLWAEAAYREKQGEEIFLSEADHAIAAAEQDKRQEDDLPCRMVDLVQSHGTELLGSNRTFAKALGCSHTQAARVLDELAQAGRVTLTKGKSGTVVRLAAVA